MFDAMKQHEGIIKPKSKQWTFDLALELVRAMQPFVQPTGYHGMIAGDVLNTGRSNGALELIYMPIRDGAQYAKPLELLTFLGETLGKGTVVKHGNATPGVTSATYKYYMQFTYDGLQVNVNIG